MAKRGGKGKGGRGERPGAGQGTSGGFGAKFLIALAVVGAGGVAFLLFAGGSGNVSGALESPLPAWAEEVEADAGAGIALGAEAAPVTIEEFADYQCPHCAQFAAFSGRLIRQNHVSGDGPARWVLHDYLVFDRSEAPAMAARCAGEQGRYWEYHDLLLARQARWAQSDRFAQSFLEYGRELGLDEGAFATCLEERRPLREVIASHRYGERMGVRGTPTVFLNGRRLNSSELTYERLEQLILAAADSAREAAAP